MIGFLLWLLGTALGIILGAAIWFGLIRPCLERIFYGEWRW